MSEQSRDLPVLAEPADGPARVVATHEDLQTLADQLRRGSGPVGLDTERAHGFRYRASAYLVQLRREDVGTVLVDPVPFGIPADLSVLGKALTGTQWVLHAASQDLPCLAEAKMFPTSLFDTELAGRLLNLPRVGLGPLIEQEFGVRLLKEHSAADWSVRPLPEDWLTYAALDVELLIPLREVLRTQLEKAGKLAWAEEEFAWLAAHAGDVPSDRVDPWRRTAGLHTLKTPTQLAVVRELWQAREEIARKLDKGPAKILIDNAMTALASRVDVKANRWPGRDDIRSIDGFNRRYARRYESTWVTALEKAKALTRAALPPTRLAHTGPPQQPRSWENRHPDEFARWQAVRPVQLEVAESVDVPPENLLSPATLRWLAWQPPSAVTPDTVADALRSHGAREWQISLLARPLAEVLA